MSYIIKFKKSANPFEIKKLCDEQINENSKKIKIEKSKNCNKNKKGNENKNTHKSSPSKYIY